MSHELKRPSFSIEKVLGLIKKEYGLSGEIKELPSYRDQNFYLKLKNGEEYVIKIANQIEKKETIEFQNAVMNHLTSKDQLYISPKVIKSKSIKIITEVQDNGNIHLLRVVTYIPGKEFAKINPHHHILLKKYGEFLGHLSHSLSDFDHPVAHYDFSWDLSNSYSVVGKYKKFILDAKKVAIVEHFSTEFLENTNPNLQSLRSSVIHNDLNEYNVIVNYKDNPFNYDFGILDFGDTIKSKTIFDLAVAIAYAILEKDDPISTAVNVIEGYNSVFPLMDNEIKVLFNLICMRLCISVANSSYQQTLDPENEYIGISQKNAWNSLFILRKINSNFAYYAFRDACNLEPHPYSKELIQLLRANQDQIHPILNDEISSKNHMVFDLSLVNSEVKFSKSSNDWGKVIPYIYKNLKNNNKEIGISRHNEVRLDYTNAQINSFNTPMVHLGISLFLNPKTPIYSPIDGTLVSLTRDNAFNNYEIILEHQFGEENLRFYTMYKNISKDAIKEFKIGIIVKKGNLLGYVGRLENNDIPLSYVHFQITLDLLGKKEKIPSKIDTSQKKIWLSLVPDPNIILKIPQKSFPRTSMNPEKILKSREEVLGKSLSVSYQTPLNMVRGYMQYLFNQNGYAYLDMVNNVLHVGHCHPEVVKALMRQAAILNTNTRYLHENVVKYAEELSKTFPEPLRVCFFVNSGSEANELALRLARTHTNQHDIICIDHSYHGNTGELVNISPYKHNGSGGGGPPPYVHKIDMPDLFRGLYKADDPNAGMKYASQINSILLNLQKNGKGVAAFIAESLLSCGGQIELPNGYLQEIYSKVRENGGVCIADEVQVGFGRIGSHFWGFELQGVVPDIVTMGKPIGNGHPLAAVVTTPEIANSFNNGMEFFTTTGGNHVSCAVGLSVLNIIKKENLQQNALNIGSYLKKALLRLKQKYSLIGDVRGEGLFIGIELVLNNETLNPAPTKAIYIVERMKEEGVLLSIDGPLHNVLKIKPPLVFTKENSDYFIEKLDKILSEDFSRPL
jgi:4-aminobutyrate aminotransferase-like enzyme/Ser/Thr protein kinase RdoA (MazF antagonist)